MKGTHVKTFGIVWVVLFFCISSPAHAEQSLVVSGIGALQGNTVTQAEKLAFDDAFARAYLEIALKHVPSSSSFDLMRKLRGFAASRGNQDILQYKIISRSQQENALLLEVEVRLNEAPLKEWLQAQGLTTPLFQRPKILLMISSRGPGLSERHEWWSTKTSRVYNPFEAQLALRLRELGENVSEVPQKISIPQAGADRIIHVASAAGAAYLITGSVTHKLTQESSLDSRLELSLVDIRTKQSVSTLSFSLRGSSDQKTMNDLLISSVIDQIRSHIAKKVTTINPMAKDKSLCIEGVRDYMLYQSLINTLRSMDSVSRITVSGIRGHTVCHSLEINGRLENVLDTLKQKQLAEADILIDGDTASIRILNP